MSSLISIFSDIHIHRHSQSDDKLNDCLECLDWVYSESIKRGVKSIIFAGDLFHDRNQINVYAYNKTWKILNKYSNKINSYFLVGNHDMFYRYSREITSVAPLKSYVKVIDSPETLKIEGIGIDFIPYTEKPQEDLKFLKNSDSKILIGHLAIQGSILNRLWGIKAAGNECFEEEIESITPKIFSSKYKRIFFGHYHSRQKIENYSHMEYIGSTLQLSFSEAMDSKGFIILDTKSMKSEFIENKFSPRYFILTEDEDLDDFPIEGGYLQVLINNKNNKYLTDMIDFKRNIKKKYKPRSVEIINYESEKKISEAKEIDDIENIILDVKTMISKYVDSIDIEIDKKETLKIGNKIIDTVNSPNKEVSI